MENELAVNFGKQEKQKPSYNTLKASLKCANEEARGYLDQLQPLRIENAQLQKDLDAYKKGYTLQSRIISALLELTESKRGAQ